MFFFILLSPLELSIRICDTILISAMYNNWLSFVVTMMMTDELKVWERLIVGIIYHHNKSCGVNKECLYWKLTHWHIHSLTHYFSYSLTNIDSPIHWVTDSLSDIPSHWLTNSDSDSLFYLFPYSLTYSLIHSPSQSVTLLAFQFRF